MANLHCLNPISKVGLNNLTSDFNIVENMDDAQGVLVRSAKMHGMEFSENLLAIARAGAGVNNIPLDECAKKGIVVFNTPGANANGVKELVIAGMMLASRDIVGGINWVQTIKGEENVDALVEKGKSQFAGTEIAGKKIGVIGLGAIGYRVANAAVDLGMEVLGYNPDIPIDFAWSLSCKVQHVESLDTIFAECDFITVHVPLTDVTKHTFRAETIEKMKDGVILLNFARDLLANDDDLEVALASGKVRHYVTDFPNAKTANMKGVIAIPHLGASTEESEDNCAIMAVDQMMDYIKNGNIVNSVNYPVCKMGELACASRVAVAHSNIPGVITKFTAAFSEAGMNIENMVSCSRGEYSYALFDVSAVVDEAFAKKVTEIEGVIKVRVLTKDN